MKILKISGIVLSMTLFVFSLNSLIRLNTWEILNDIKFKDILQLGEKKHNIKYLKTEDIEIATDEWNSSSPMCLESQKEDSKSFGVAIEINDKYLAVGDPRANKVIIYSHDQNSNWIRLREIKAPNNSIPDKIGFGFGYKLALDGDILVISGDVRQASNKVIHPEYYQFKTITDSYFHGIYKTNIKEKTKVERIDIMRKGIIRPGYSIASDGGKIAFTAAIENKFEDKFSEVNILSKRNLVSLPKSRHRIKLKNFSPSIIDLKNNFLIAISQPFHNKGFAWLFDLNTTENKPIELDLPDIENYNSVEISNKFIVALGENFKFKPFERLTSGIVIQDFINGNTTVIKNSDAQTISLSLDDNILVTHSFLSPGSNRVSLLEIFRIDNQVHPYLIKRQIIDNKDKHLYKFLYQNGFFATSIIGEKVCIEHLNFQENIN